MVIFILQSFLHDVVDERQLGVWGGIFWRDERRDLVDGVTAITLINPRQSLGIVLCLFPVPATKINSEQKRNILLLIPPSGLDFH